MRILLGGYVSVGVGFMPINPTRLPTPTVKHIEKQICRYIQDIASTENDVAKAVQKRLIAESGGAHPWGVIRGPVNQCFVQFNGFAIDIIRMRQGNAEFTMFY